MALLCAPLTHALGRNEVCDSWRRFCGKLVGLRGATAPSRNTLAPANKQRPAPLAEKRFWATLEQLQRQSPRFAAGGAGRRLAPRFKAAISVVDSTPLQRIAPCLDWAQPRRRQAAAKCHVRLDRHSQLPRFALVDPARANDAKRARAVCAGLRAGASVVFDKAAVDWAHLHEPCLSGCLPNWSGEHCPARVRPIPDRPCNARRSGGSADCQRTG